MRDQADHLRRMVLTAARAAGRRSSERPLLVISGGAPGVGVTTLAIELARQWVRHATCRVRLVDANFTHPELAARCGQAAQATLGDVLEGKRTMGEVLLRGPHALQIVPGRRYERPVIERLFARAGPSWIEHLRQPGDGADLVIVDAGAGRGDIVGRLWEAATTILLATTPAPHAILDGYAAIKAAARRAPPEKICVVANRVDPARNRGGEIERRLRETCRRFLEVEIEAGPSVAERPAIGGSSPAGGQLGAAPVVRPLAQHLARRLGLTHTQSDRPHDPLARLPRGPAPPERPVPAIGSTSDQGAAEHLR